MMQISDNVHILGKHPDGTPVLQVELERDGLSVKLLSIGATLQDLRCAPHKHALVLGYPDPMLYLDNPNYFGSTVGRFANRLCSGKAFLMDKPIQVEIDPETGHHLHGGSEGAAAQNWVLAGHSKVHAQFELRLPDGHMGFPGQLTTRLTYTLLPSKTLEIDIKAQTDMPTFCSFAHHSYFNLTGNAGITGHQLQVDAQAYVPVDAQCIPTGQVLDVIGTDFDFRHARDVSPNCPLDHNLCLSNARRKMQPVATLTALNASVSKENLSMHIATTEPGLQVYTGHGIALGGPLGHNGVSYGPCAGLALEPQIWPDAPNHDGFPTAMLMPNEVYHQVSQFKFESGYRVDRTTA
jgi:aldose 1-epimerase